MVPRCELLPSSPSLRKCVRSCGIWSKLVAHLRTSIQLRLIDILSRFLLLWVHSVLKQLSAALQQAFSWPPAIISSSLLLDLTLLPANTRLKRFETFSPPVPGCFSPTWNYNFAYHLTCELVRNTSCLFGNNEHMAKVTHRSGSATISCTYTNHSNYYGETGPRSCLHQCRQKLIWQKNFAVCYRIQLEYVRKSFRISRRRSQRP